MRPATGNRRPATGGCPMSNEKLQVLEPIKEKIKHK
jgi:hypothetical protein